MSQIIESLLRKYDIDENAVRNGEVRLSTLRDIVRSEGHSVEVFKAILSLRG